MTDLTSKSIIKELLEKYDAAPLKQLGQHFLVDKGVLRKIIEAANLSPDDTVLEIGPGIGTLTQELAKRAGKVIAVEKDQKMCQILAETIKDFGNVEIVNRDALKLDPRPYTLKPYKIVANLPYYIVSPVIRKFLENTETPIPSPSVSYGASRPLEMVLMVQKEVAQRICSKPPDMNLLAVSVQFYAKPEIINYVSKKSFWPSPKVDSAIIKIKIDKKQLTINKDLFFGIIKAGFSQPRKQLINNLSAKLKIPRIKTEDWLSQNKIQPTQRAETLTIEDWISLAKTFLASNI